jgi:hypothetical protein
VSARRLALLAVALLAACNKTSSKPGPRFNGPSAVALFHGLTTRVPTAPSHPYLAVANLRGDELRLVDAVDGGVVLAPSLILSLSVSTEPRPSRLAAGSLQDRDKDGKPVALADLLVVAPAGMVSCSAAVPGRLSACIQVVDTWTTRNAVVDALTIDLGDPLEAAGAADAEILSLAVLPATDAAGAGVAGKARLAAGLTGGRLLLADYARQADGSIARDGPSVVLEVGFDALSLAPGPDGSRLYAATDDVIPGSPAVQGVADVDLTGALAQAARVRGLDAGGPTTVVMATMVRRFTGFRYATGSDPSTWDPLRDSYGAGEPRVYAARSPVGCGPTEAVECGIAVLDPLHGGAAGTGGLALDPAPAPGPVTTPRFHATIRVPGQVLAMAAIPPPTVGGLCDDGAVAPCRPDANPISIVPYQSLFLARGARWASTLAAAASSNGSVYLLDLGHDGLANAQDWLATDTSGLQAQVSSATFASVAAGQGQLALWNDLDASPPTPLTRDATAAKALVRATPGFTMTDSWSVSWQGALPGLADLTGQAEVAADGTVAWIAIQSPTFLGAEPFRGVGRLYHPRLAIRPARPGHLGDIVLVTPLREPGDGPDPIDTSAEVETARATQYCPFGSFELEVAALLPPSDLYPGGAVAVRDPSKTAPTWKNWTQPKNTFGTTPAGVARTEEADPKCMARAADLLAGRPGPVHKPVAVTFLAGELLLTGVTFGYAGRPEAQASGSDPGFLLQDDATGPPPSCPMLEGAAWPSPCDDTTCRDACERTLLGRKARRVAYVESRCATTDAECLKRWAREGSTSNNKLDFPSPTGPVLGLKLGWSTEAGGAATPDLTDAAAWPPRSNLLTILTSGGLSEASRVPLSGTARTGTLLPAGVVAWSRPDFTGIATDHVQVFTAYPDNLLLSFAPALSPGSAGLIR